MTVIAGWAIELPPEGCRQLGFSSSTLMCSTCDELSHYNLSILNEGCQKCCQKDKNTEDRNIAHFATLEVCG